MRRRRKVIAPLVGLRFVAGIVPAVQAAGPARPSRVLIVVLDQARPDTIERYGMRNVQALMRDGASFPNALVGDMAAETVISHNVITSGQFPKHMGWSDEVDTMAAPYGPDVVAQLETDVTYGTIGDHGGHQRLVQNIPMVFYGPGVGSKDSNKSIRLVDVLPTVLRTMGIGFDEHDLDGTAVKLPTP